MPTPASQQDLISELIVERRLALRKWFAARLPAGLDAARDPDDLVQETWMRGRLGAERLHSTRTGSAWAWIMKIAERVLIDALRAGRAHGQTSSPAGVEVHVVPLTQLLEIRGVSNGAGSELERVERALQIALAALSANRRAVLELHYVDGLSYKEIAARLGKTERAVQALVTLGREQLRQQFAHAYRRPRRR